MFYGIILFEFLYKIFFKGLVDIGKEISKLDNKLEKTEAQLSKLMEAMKIEDYEKKVG